MKIQNFSDYEFYEDGRVFSYKVNKFLTPYLGSDGYLQLDCIDDNGKRKRHTLNNWICRAFYGEPPFNNAEAMHLDENPMNCHYTNLRWGSHKENINYGLRTSKNAISHYKKIKQYDLNGKLINIFESIKQASEITGISYTGIIKAAKGKIKTSGGYIWHYI